MARFVSPITDMKPNGSLRFFKSGTNSTLVTYKDELETPGLENPVIVPVLANGNIQNVFFSGSAKVVYLDEFGVQYAERDPVGSEVGFGAFALWEATVTYSINDIVEGSDGKFYQSISNGNINNDPTTTPTSWKEIRFIGVWNTNVTYAMGEVVQTTDGNLWKAVVSTVGNEPSTDSGANWLPAVDDAKIPAIISLTWITKDADFTAVNKESYQIDASSNTVDVTMPILVANNDFTFHNEAASTFKVQILNPLYTINGPDGSFLAGTDIELAPGDSVQMVAKSTSILEIVGAQV